MISKFIVEFLQHLLKEAFPGFAYWLFYSEATVALAIGSVAMLAWEAPTMAVPLLSYAAFNHVAARNYARKRAISRGSSWLPSTFDKITAGYLQLSIVGIGLFLFVLGSNSDRQYLIWAIGLGLVIGGAGSFISLLRGGWSD